MTPEEQLELATFFLSLQETRMATWTKWGDNLQNGGLRVWWRHLMGKFFNSKSKEGLFRDDLS